MLPHFALSYWRIAYARHEEAVGAEIIAAILF